MTQRIIHDNGSKVAQSSLLRVPLDFVVCAGLEGVSTPPITGRDGVCCGCGTSDIAVITDGLAGAWKRGGAETAGVVARLML